MSVSDLSLVNQRLSYARVLLDDLKATEHANDAFKAHALLDACVFHLNCALTHYLREISTRHKLPAFTSIITLSSIGKELQQRSIVSAEFEELTRLNVGAGSWLANLQAAYHGCWVQAAIESVPSTNSISVVNLDAVESATPTLQKVLLWHEAMVELISRQRESAVEC